MHTGLTFDEYVDLRLRPPVGADGPFHEAGAMERERLTRYNALGWIRCFASSVWCFGGRFVLRRKPEMKWRATN